VLLKSWQPKCIAVPHRTKKLVVAYLVHTFLAFCGTATSISVFTRPPPPPPHPKREETKEKKKNKKFHNISINLSTSPPGLGGGGGGADVNTLMDVAVPQKARNVWTR
jgi:hypothetical protein